MSKTKKKKAAAANRTKSNAQSSSSSKVLLYAPYLLVLCGLFIFSNLFKADFINYDDPDYVTENSYVTGQEGLFSIFSSPSAGNYHPLTMISLRLDYALGKGEPKIFHAVNLLLHLANSLLIYFFFFRFSKKNRILALLTCAFFLLHPAHVEAVAWVSSRKDVLYAFFFLLGLIAYLKSKEQKGKVWLPVLYLMFLLALIAKPAAAVFPIILVLIDVYQNGSFSKKALLEKIPLFVISAVFLFITWQIQKGTAVDRSSSFLDNASFAGLGILKYLTLAVAPLKLSVLHPYPAGSVSFIYLMVLAVLIAAIILAYKKKKMAWFFGLSFFFVSLILVLQFVAVGRALIAERYTYLAFVGLFFIPAFYASHEKIGKGVLAACTLMLLWFSFLSFERSKEWNNSKDLWSQTMKVYPEDWYAYFGRGEAYEKDGLMVEAVQDYTNGLKYKPDEERLLLMRGRAFALNREHSNALNDLDQLLLVNPNNSKGLIARGKVYFETGRPLEARRDFNRAISLGEGSPLIFTNLASAYASENKMDSAILLYKKALSMNQLYTEAHLNLANALNISSRQEEALESLKNYLSSGGAKNSRYHYTSALVKLELNQFESAMRHVDNAIKISGSFPELISLKGLVFLGLGQKENARIQAREAQNMATRMNQPFTLPAELEAILK